MNEEVESHVLKKYEILQKLGKGAYGVVWRCKDKKTQQVLALKKIFDAFQDPNDSQKTYREIMLLQAIDHENVVKIVNLMKAENDRDIYVLFEYMETDLSQVIKAKLLDDIHIQYITYQIIKGIKFLHSAKLIHRDLKPSNILVNPDASIKIADFGLARSVLVDSASNEKINLTENVATNMYKSPEVLFGLKYDQSMDMWSIGCILGEMLLGKPMFTGISNKDQFNKMVEFLGKPPTDELKEYESALMQPIIKEIESIEVKGLSSSFPKASKEALSLLKDLLETNPQKRITADEALYHPYLQDFLNLNEDEKEETENPITVQLNDNQKYSIREYRDNLYTQISKKKRSVRKQIFSKMDDNNQKN